MSRRLLMMLGTSLFAATAATAQTTTPPGAAQEEKKAEEERVKRTEEVLVTATSPVETELINSPATLSVITSRKLEASPSQNVGDLIRAVPGVNVIQMSARDFNVTARQSTNTLANSQLTLLDGRSIYLDFFGLVLWDFVPTNMDEIKQIEVVRGPASAVWGANALTGVISIITKTPREVPVGEQTSVTLSAGAFDRDIGSTAGEGQGNTFGASASITRVPNDTWSYRISGGYYNSDALARPTAKIPVIDDPRAPGTKVGGATLPPFANQGTSQPRFDFRLDQDMKNGGRLTYGAGAAGTKGIIHSGIGPFDIKSGSYMGYGKVNYSKGAFKLNTFVNTVDVEASNLLSVDLQGKPVALDFTTQTYDIEVGNSNVLAGKHILAYGASARRNNFDITIAPNSKDRTELGAYLQDEIFFEKFRFVIGGRVDKFGNIDGAVFSPRLTAMYKPTPAHAVRASYNKAFRSPSTINNYADFSFKLVDFPLGAVCQAIPPLCAANPGIARQTLPLGPRFLGNPDLKEESLTAYEVAYTGTFAEKTTVSAAFYINDTDNNLNFISSPAVIASAKLGPGYPSIYTSANPPPGWPFPAFVVDALRPAVFGRVPATVTYLNLGPIRNRGVELSLDHRFTNDLSAGVNYSWQDKPEVLEADSDQIPYAVEEIALPATNRFNANVDYSGKRFVVNLSVNYSDKAFWSDVLTADYNGFTDSYTLVNGTFGVRWNGGKVTTSLKVTNILNQDVQQHNFGDLLKRSVVLEARFKF